MTAECSSTTADSGLKRNKDLKRAEGKSFHSYKQLKHPKRMRTKMTFSDIKRLDLLSQIPTKRRVKGFTLAK